MQPKSDKEIESDNKCILTQFKTILKHDKNAQKIVNEHTARLPEPKNNPEGSMSYKEMKTFIKSYMVNKKQLQLVKVNNSLQSSIKDLPELSKAEQKKLDSRFYVY